MTTTPSKTLFICSLIVFLSAIFSPVRASGIDDFKSDGCSLFPDGSIADRRKWCDCCFTHDIAYWQGGTEVERREADLAFKDCIYNRTGNANLAKVMFDGVRAGGHPVFPVWYRWGYGWKYGRGYAPLTEKEQELADGKLEQYYNSHPRGYCTGPEKVRANRSATP